jgi:GTP-binding protein
MDLPDAQAQWPAVEEVLTRYGVPCQPVSAVTGENVQPLLFRALAMLDALPPTEEREEPVMVIEPEPDRKAFQIVCPEPNVWVVEGIEIERAARMTNWTYYEAALRFQRILSALGITEALRAAGVQDGDTVQIGETELTWGYENAFGE